MSAGETDEPVTCDVKRLIRLPASLHGNTGLKVTKILLDDLQDFNPLNDAIVFSNNLVKIKLHRSFKIRMKEENFHLEEEIQKMPTYLAIFLIGRKVATII